jgi:hypothetical protein
LFPVMTETTNKNNERTNATTLWKTQWKANCICFGQCRWFETMYIAYFPWWKRGFSSILGWNAASLVPKRRTDLVRGDARTSVQTSRWRWCILAWWLSTPEYICLSLVIRSLYRQSPLLFLRVSLVVVGCGQNTTNVAW